MKQIIINQTGPAKNLLQSLPQARQYSNFKGSNINQQLSEDVEKEEQEQEYFADCPSQLYDQDVQNFETYDLASPSYSEQMYQDLKNIKYQEKLMQKTMKTELYKSEKVAKLQRDEIKPLNSDNLNHQVDKLLSGLESSLLNLEKHQVAAETAMDITRLFANELNIKISKGHTYYMNGDFHKVYREVASFSIYEDSQSQMIMVDSSISGLHCFEFNNKYRMWMSQNNEFFVQFFIQEELQLHTKGKLDIN